MIPPTFDRVLVDVLTHVAHLAKSRQGLIKLSDRILDRCLACSWPRGQERSLAKPAQADDEELKVSPPAKNKSSVLWLLGLNPSTLESDHVDRFVRQTAGPFDGGGGGGGAHALRLRRQPSKGGPAGRLPGLASLGHLGPIPLGPRESERGPRREALGHGRTGHKLAPGRLRRPARGAVESLDLEQSDRQRGADGITGERSVEGQQLGVKSLGQSHVSGVIGALALQL